MTVWAPPESRPRWSGCPKAEPCWTASGPPANSPAWAPSVGSSWPATPNEAFAVGAALWAAQLARSYAPDLDVRGVMASAPAADLPTIVTASSSPPFSAYLGNVLIGVDGLDAGYGRSFNPASFLTPAALADLTTVSSECVDATIARWRDRPRTALLARDPTTIPAVEDVLTENSAGATNPGVPIFLGQGDHDQQIPLQVLCPTRRPLLPPRSQRDPPRLSRSRPRRSGRRRQPRRSQVDQRPLRRT